MRYLLTGVLIATVLALIARVSCADDAAVEYIVQVDAGEHDRHATPVSVELPAELSNAGDLELLSVEPQKQLSIQRIPGEGARATFILQESLLAGQSRVYRLRSSLVLISESTVAPAVSCRRTESGLRIDLRRDSHNSAVLQYNTAVVEPPTGIDGVYRRSGHIHPVWTPSARAVTEEFPEDHPHQHGIFDAWVNTTFEGRAVDFWNQAGGTGMVEHVNIESSVDGDVFAECRAQLRHSELTDPDGPRPVLGEQMLVRAYNVPQGHLFDIESRQVCAGQSPLIINEFHYGGMAWRGAAGWLGQPEHDFLTSEGKTRADGNHTRPVWVAAHGLVDGEACGIVVFGHPQNFRHPHPVRLHPNKPYFVFTPPVLGSFAIEPGAEYVSRYRYLVHDGPLDPEWYDRVWRDIAEPPAVRVVAASPQAR